MASPYLLKRRAAWYLRVRVPTDLSRYLGIHLTRTLHTRDHAIARQRANLAVASLQGFWNEARMVVSDVWMGKSVDEVGPDEIHQASIDRKRAVADIEALGQEAKVRLKHKLEVALSAVSGFGSVLTGQRETTEKLLSELKAERQKGVIEGMEKALCHLPSLLPSPAPLVSEPPIPNPKNDIPWNSHFNEFFKFQGLVPKTQGSYKLAFSRLDEIVKGKSINEITKKDIQEYRDAASEIAPRSGRPATAAATIEKYLSHLKTYFAWASGEAELIEINPTVGITVTKAQRKVGVAIKRLPYSKEELLTIFDAPLFVGCKAESRRFVAGSQIIKDDKFWLSVIGLFTGARLSEITQLTTQDIMFIEGHDCLSINLKPVQDDDIKDDELLFNKTLKNGNAVRIVPIHPILKKIGLMDWVQIQKRRNKVNLFVPDYNYGKFWNETFLNKIGIKNPSISFHSFRHTYKRGIRMITNAETQNRLMGHAPSTIGEVYGGGLDENEARSFVENFQVPIDLSHLYRTKGI